MHAGRAIQRHTSKGREEEQGTHLPRTSPGSAMSPFCFWDWSWRTLEWRSRNFLEAPRPHQSPPNASPSAPLPHQRPDPPLERHAPACGHACLCSIRPWPRTYLDATTSKATPLPSVRSHDVLKTHLQSSNCKYPTNMFAQKCCCIKTLPQPCHLHLLPSHNVHPSARYRILAK